MGLFSNVLFTSDFDHTISDMDNRVATANVDAIRYFISEGGLFCLNSGRGLPLMRPKLGLIPVNAPCLLYNGAACYDFSKEELLYANYLPPFAEELMQTVRAMNPKLNLEVQKLDGHYEIGDNASRVPFLRSEGVEPIFTDGNISQPWMKLVICGVTDGPALEDPAKLSQEDREAFARLYAFVKEFCGDRCYVTRSMPRVMEISNPDCNKGTAAKALAKKLNRSILVCAGDAPNDEQMLRAADFAFCPTDCDPEILAVPGIRSTVPSHVGCIAEAVEQLKKIVV